MTDQPGNNVALPSDEQSQATEPPATVGTPENMPASELVVWAFEARQAHAISQSLSRTAFVPQSMRNNPDAVTAAILTGNEIGMQPMAALRSMDIIQGTPALRANAMRGLLQSRGHEIELLETDDQHCTMRGRRWHGALRGFGAWQQVTWTIERARRQGLLSKSTWQNMPEDMLIARATGQLCRLIASDVMLALPYAAEELADGDTRPEPRGRVTVGELTAAAAPSGPAQPPGEPTAPPAAPEPATPPPAPAEEPAKPEPDAVEATIDPDPEPEQAFPPAEPDPMEPRITTRQIGAVHNLAGKLGLAFGPKDDRTEYLAVLSAVVGRDVTSSKDLTVVEAGHVISTWQAQIDGAPS